MRLARIAATTLIAGSLTFAGTGIALAATPVTVPTSSTSAAVVSEPGRLMLSASSVKPGASVQFSGTFAEPAASTATGPITVTSPAFAGPATMTRTDPEAFSGSAVVAAGAKPGTYTVTASSSAGTVTSTLTVPGAAPAPTPAHHGGTAAGAGAGAGTHGSGHGSSSGSSSSTSTDTATETDTIASSTELETGSDMLPWVLGGAGAVVLIGGGAYAIGRGRRGDRADLQAGQDYREPRTEVMSRR
ncbi:hypothetical protein [Actinomycetospora atypica]|uniref:Uncharacterized protein n=1 Tax=Actinomycetospora atypica TaxID=1290095 RepID=A0ABV9YHU6_9PSEU